MLFSFLILLSPLVVSAGQTPLRVAETHKLKGRFLHVTDFHPDFFYQAGAPLEDICHFEPNTIAASDHDKDKKKHKNPTAGIWGPPPGTDCDTPINLVNATFDFIRSKIIDELGGVDFVVWTGDNARHDNDNRYPRTLKQIYSSNEFMIEKFNELFPADRYGDSGYIPVVPTFGNNDVYPHNLMFPGPNSPTIATFKDMWKKWVPPEQSHTFDRGGYFHMSVAPKLSVISLNSLYFYENNKAVDGCSARDEAGTLQLDWLSIQLRLFRMSKTKVWIIGHIPPTQKQWYDECYSRYANLMVEFRDIVIGQIYGHMNIDHFFFESYDFDWNKASVASNKDFKTLAKNPLTLLQDLRTSFDDLPKYDSSRASQQSYDVDGTIGHLSVVNVGPSVVPNYFPTLRVFEYNITDTNDAVFEEQAKKKHKKKKPKKPKKPSLPVIDSLGPAFRPQLYTPIKYTQYFLNTSDLNSHSHIKNPQYEIEYSTTEAPYNMTDLTVGSYVELGRKISGLNGLGKYDSDVESKKKHKNKRHDGIWKMFVKRAFVSTGMEHIYTNKQQDQH